MAFIETRFPESISIGATGGPGFQTDVVSFESGFEQRNVTWADSRRVYDVSHGLKDQAGLNTLIAFFTVMKGRANGFRFKDWTDYQAASGEGVFTQIDATHFQMWKRYTAGGVNVDREITKPVNGTVTVTGGVPLTLDYATGIVTMSSGTPTSWIGEFDVPCRFDTDQMKTSIQDYGIFAWGNIPVVEIRV